MNELKNSKTCIKCTNPKIDTFHCLQHKDTKIKWDLKISLPSIRSAVMKSDSNLEPNELWQKEIPSDTKQLAIYEAVKAFKTSVASKKIFKLQYKKRNVNQLFWVDGRALKNKNGSLHIFVTRLEKDSKLNVNGYTTSDTKFTNTRIINDRGTWYLLHTYKRPKEVFDKPKYNVISLDPGIRTFQTGYSPDGITVKFGEEQIEQIKKIHKRIDLLKSAKTNIKHGYQFKSKSDKPEPIKIGQCRRNMKAKQAKLEKKVYDVTSNLHNQVSAYLTNNFEHILLPEFGTSEMVKQNKLQKCTKRMMNSLSFYRFKQKITEQCQRKNRQLHTVSEAFTTKTCGSCGTLTDVGCNKIYKCTNCEYTLDRDVHGSRNILVRFLTRIGC